MIKEESQESTEENDFTEPCGHPQGDFFPGGTKAGAWMECSPVEMKYGAQAAHLEKTQDFT